jgi:hypothetical protein
MTAHPSGVALPAMDEVFRGTTTDNIPVPKKALASMRMSSESSSNITDESDLQYEKHDEQRI